MSDHFRPTAEIAADVLAPSDPGLALALAQALMAKPLMANHHHGLWGYSGQTAEGRFLTVQATGIGGPSTALVIGELAAHGARRMIRIGRCTALEPGLAPGHQVLVAGALADDGASRALGATTPQPDPELSAGLAAAGAESAATVAGCDLTEELASPQRRAAWRRRGAAVADLETAAFLAHARALGLPAAALLTVAEGAGGERDPEAVEDSLIELGSVAVAGFAAERAQAPAPGARLP